MVLMSTDVNYAGGIIPIWKLRRISGKPLFLYPWQDELMAAYSPCALALSETRSLSRFSVDNTLKLPEVGHSVCLGPSQPSGLEGKVVRSHQQRF